MVGKSGHNALNLRAQIRHTPFGAIANLPKPARDVELVADDFRQWARRGGKPLRGDRVTEMFAGFCRHQKPAN